MGFLFTSKKKEKIVAIFDIGSGSVGGAIVSIPNDKNILPTIIKSTRTEIKPRENLNTESFSKDMILALDLTINSLYHTRSGAPEEIICVLASPFYISETRVIKKIKDTPFIFTSKVASELIDKEIASIKDLYKDRYSEQDNSLEVIEEHTMSVSLNGYHTEDPLGKKAKMIEMNMIISLAPKLYLDKIRQTLSKTFHHTKVSFSSFTVSTYLAVRDKYIGEDSYLLIDISGEITDVGIVTKGVLRSVLSFPFGKNTFFKYMCTKLEIELRDAKELFKLYSDDKLTAEYKKKVIPLFKSIENSWGEAFHQCVGTLPRALLLPSVIFLTADNDIKNWFRDVLRNEEYLEKGISGKKGIVITLEGSNFLDMCGVGSEICDPFLMIESIATMRKKIR